MTEPSPPAFKVVRRMEPVLGTILLGDLNPYRKSRMTDRMHRLSVPAGGCQPPGYTPYRCVPAANGEEFAAALANWEAPPEVGSIFIPMHLLYELNEQDRWASEFGNALLINDPAVARALVEHGLAEQETRGGYHGTARLEAMLDSTTTDEPIEDVPS
jgi:hypothetical protein